MTNFVESLSGKSKQNWALLYKKLTGKEWKPDVADDRGVSCEVNIEPIEEIKEIMESNRDIRR